VNGIARGIGIFIVALPAAWIGGCSYLQSGWKHGFATLHPGDSEATVVAAIGEPTHREARDEGFARFADAPCRDACTQRLWYATRMGLDIEAWSVALDADGRATLAHWVSP
jgi:hypothetical protein